MTPALALLIAGIGLIALGAMGIGAWLYEHNHRDRFPFCDD